MDSTHSLLGQIENNHAVQQLLPVFHQKNVDCVCRGVVLKLGGIELLQGGDQGKKILRKTTSRLNEYDLLMLLS